jgi:peptidoglycan/LPS O-acetylase OafA/YrhL
MAVNTASGFASTATATATVTRRRPGLDLLRGLAVLFVLIRHAGLSGGGGVVGVVVFFALSGYLITGLLQRDLRARGTVDYRRFYLHRAFRLIPALVAMVCVWASIELVWNPMGDRPNVGRSVLVALTYTANLPGFSHGSESLGHLWTLATEEQFYLLWPLALTIGFRYGRTRLLTAVGCVGMTLLCATSLVAAHGHVERVYGLPTSWMVAMLIGAAAKLGEPQLDRALQGDKGRGVAVASLLALAAISFAPDLKGWWGTYLLLGPTIAACTVGLIFECKRWDRLPAWWLKPLLGLGVISYAAYLWNYPIVKWMGDPATGVVDGLATIPPTIIAAVASWYLVEKPAARLRRRLDRRGGTFSAAQEGGRDVAVRL